MEQAIKTTSGAPVAPKPDEDMTPKQGKGAMVLVTVVIGLLLAGAVVTFVLRMGEKRALAKETETLAVPTVAVVHPRPEPPEQEVVLPSTLQAFTESPIYARTNGYVAKWYHDIGSRVEKGELLADIETPEVDQELVQAKAARDQAQAQLEIAKTSAQRWENLRKMDAVAQQETDERSNTFVQGQANLANSAANVKRLEQLESFKHVYAPFSGVITKRSIDIGALINAGNGGSTFEMFDLARIDPIRVYVEVPETYASLVRTGVKGSIELTSLPGRRFTGSVARTADAIDPASRTLRTELDVPNPKGELFPGSYAQVHFAVKVNTPRLAVPVNALLFRSEGMRAVVVDSNGKVHLKPVIIGRDYGTEVEVLGGLDPSDVLVLNPRDSLEDGQQVNLGEQPGQTQPQGAPRS